MGKEGCTVHALPLWGELGDLEEAAGSSDGEGELGLDVILSEMEMVK